MKKYILRSNGNYIGFIDNNNIFSRDCLYLGWVEGNYVWDKNGNFRGILTEINGNQYVILNQLQIPPIPRIPRLQPLPPTPPMPAPNILPISLPVGYIDGL